MKLIYATSRCMILICGVGLLAVACSARKKQDTTQIVGAGERFHAITVHSNNFDATSIYKSGTHGQPIWAEWDLDRDGNPDTTTFSFDGKNIASVYTAPNKPPGFDFSFYGRDGKVRTLWIARAGSDTFTDRLSYDQSEPRLERFVNGKWETVVERNHKRGVISSGQWFQLSYTNGSWTIVSPGESGNDE
jgi:hypothetical protein